MGGSSRRRGERREDSGKARVRWQGILQARWHGGLGWLEVHRPSAPLRHTHTHSLVSVGAMQVGEGSQSQRVFAKIKGQ